MNSKDAEPEVPQWDFERNVAQTVKLQIKLLLSYVDKTVKNKEERRNRYLLPLKYLLFYRVPEQRRMMSLILLYTDINKGKL